MGTKICTKCNVEKPLDKFYSNKHKSKGKSHICKKCQNDYSKAHYYLNKKEYINRNIEVKNRNKNYLRRVKSILGCYRCGEIRWWVLEFHHLRDKEIDVSKMIQNMFSIKKIKDELRKCRVVCANCHKDIHHKEKCGVV